LNASIAIGEHYSIVRAQGVKAVVIVVHPKSYRETLHFAQTAAPPGDLSGRTRRHQQGAGQHLQKDDWFSETIGLGSDMANDTTFLLGHSPDPDDAFMFYAMAEQKIDLRGYRFEHILQDIETLNQRARRGELHLSAVSIHAYAYLMDRYALLPCGASMGDGYGPMLVAAPGREGMGAMEDAERVRWLQGRRVAVPGPLTSAFLALRLYAGEVEAVMTPFDKIFDVLRAGEADVGLLIHEGQLTYAEEGFALVRDLGAWWKERTGLPLPLGGNVVRRDLAPEVRRDLREIMQESIEYGLAHRLEGVRHSLPLARGLDEGLTDRFVGMYVNDYTVDYGESGREAVRRFLREGAAAGWIPEPTGLAFSE